ncbi:hypothetical protein FXO38_05655 [Capsicum annuum]|nr:hypothetical protein FXO38_05655 [Capsicum annuum]
MVEEILQMYQNLELRAILELLMDPTWLATGLKVDFDTLVNECGEISCRISEIISVHGEGDQKISSYAIIPNDFFEDIESLWKGRVKRIHLEEAYTEVERAADALSLAITEDFLPIISRIRATMSPLGGAKGEILYAREHGAVWFKGKRFIPTVWAGTAGEEQIKHLRPALDSKGKKVGEEWFTTMRVEDAILRYHEASSKAKSRVLELLRGLSSELQSKINILILASVLIVIAKALFSHVSLQVAAAIARYSASALDRPTTRCFSLFQDTKLPPTKTQYLDVERLSEGDPAQLASVYSMICSWPRSSKSSPLPGDDFIYRKIRTTASQ